MTPALKGRLLGPPGKFPDGFSFESSLLSVQSWGTHTQEEMKENPKLKMWSITKKHFLFNQLVPAQIIYGKLTPSLKWMRHWSPTLLSFSTHTCSQAVTPVLPSTRSQEISSTPKKRRPFQSVQSRSHVRLFATPWIAACQASLSIINSQSSFKLTSIESVNPSSHLILCHPLLLLPSIPPSIRVFSNESTLHMRWPKYWISASASVLPMNTQDWSPLEWTGWISLQSKGLSRVFSYTTVQKHQFFSAQFSSQSNSYIHTWPLEKP